MTEDIKMDIEFSVIKRSGIKEQINYEKITKRLRNLCNKTDLQYINPSFITSKIASEIKNNMTTQEIDELAAIVCEQMSLQHYRYGNLGARILINNLQSQILP